MSTTDSRLWDLYALCYDAITKSVPYQKLQSLIVNKLDLKPGQRVLNVGCGTGNLEATLEEKQIPNLEVVAVDISPKMLERAEKKCRNPGKVNFIQADVNQPLKFPDKNFDRITTVHTLYTLENPGRIIGELARVLKSGGRLVLAEPKPNAQLRAVFAENFKEIGFLKTVVSIFSNLPAVVWVSLINQIGLRKKIEGNHQRFGEGGLLEKLRESGLEVIEALPAYANQDIIIVAEKR